jgi:tRNA threonylcarbamoyladenosine biosynthesis protein TsaB
MRVLGLETSGDLAGVAVVDASGLLAAVRFRHRMELSRLLFPQIEQVLALARVALTELEGIAVSAGPGSFTGLRMGVTAAKSLAYGLGLPVASVDTLEAIAAAQPLPEGALLWAVISASSTELFAAGYRRARGRLEAVEAPELLAVAALVQRLQASPGPVIVAGQPGPHGAALGAALGERLVSPAGSHAPSPEVVAHLGRERLLAGKGQAAHTLAPRYLRVSTPEARRQAAEEAACPSS